MLKPYDIRQKYDEILPHLLYIRERFNTSWRPEDVYHACRSGKSHLWFAPDAFAIVERYDDEHSAEAVLFVWISHGEGMAQNKYMAQLEEIARGVGASRIEMESPRRGFERTGWNAKKITYSREVRNE